jgi:predicted outer membrane repeat protein
MKRIILIAFCLLLQLSLSATIRYVKQGAPVTNGTGGWSNACGDLQHIINISSSGDQIWVAKGTYKPSASGNRAFSFEFKNGVEVYGSFQGTETAIEQRNNSDSTAVSVLSGDLNGDDTPDFGNRGDNSRCVVRMVGWSRGERCYMDGFVIRGGYYKKSDAPQTYISTGLNYFNGRVGAGIYLWGSPHYIANCVIADNYAADNGGGAYISYHYNFNFEWNAKDLKFELPPVFFNTVFINNKTDGNGGGLYYDYVVDTKFLSALAPLAISTALSALLPGAKAGAVYTEVIGKLLLKQMVKQMTSVALNALYTGVQDTILKKYNPRNTDKTDIHSFAVLFGCNFIKNNAKGSGGGLWTNTSNTLLDCAFTQNESGNKGGAIYCMSGSTGGSVNFDIGNVIGMGLNKFRSADGMFLNRCRIKGNRARTYGGGVYTESPPLVTTSDYVGAALYSVAFGVPFYLVPKFFTVSVPAEYYANSEFTGNRTAKKNGGALYSSLKNPQIVNCTFAGNNADQGGGISLNRAHCKVNNSIIWGSYARSNNHHEVYKPPLSTFKTNNSIIRFGGFDNVSTSNPAFISPVSNDLAPTSAGNYGITKLSPAWNTGNNTYLADVPGNNLDVAGNTRVAYCTVDKGAFEVNSPLKPDENGILYVNNQAAPGGDGSSWANAVKELADAIQIDGCNAANFKEIWVAKGTYKPMYNAQNLTAAGDPKHYAFVINLPLKIYGGFSGTETSRSQRSWQDSLTILDGSLDASTNVYHTLIFAHNSYSAVLDGITVTNGRASSTSYGSYLMLSNSFVFAYKGGGIYICGNTAPSITNCSITGNGASNVGGGIFIEDGSGVKLYNCSITNNYASGLGQSEGGGLYMGAGGAIITNCAFKGNQAWNKGGAFMANQDGTSYLTNCLFSGNKIMSGASGVNPGGAAINITGSAKVNLLNTTIAGNYSPTLSAAVQVENTSLHPVLENCIVWGNRQGSNPVNWQLVNTCIVKSSLVEEGFPAGNGGSATNISTSDPLFYLPYTGTDVNTPSLAGDYNIPANSPARDSGTTSYYMGGSGSPSANDLLSYNRIEGCAIDKGAYEYQDNNTSIFPDIRLEPDNGVVYVDSSVALSGDGHSWQAAVKELADAARIAQIDNRIKIIKVARGTYLPRYSGDVNCGAVANSNKTFVMKGVPFEGYLIQDTVKYGWFGGYPSGGGSDDMRNPDLYPTILDGNMASNHVVVKTLYSNMAAPYPANCSLDGFVIRKGSAYAPGSLMVNGSIAVDNNRGAGIYIKRDNVNSTEHFSILNCQLQQNYAGYAGAALYLDTVSSVFNFNIYNCTFKDNHVSLKGGAVYLQGNQNNTINARITNCLFAGNESYHTTLGNKDGGALYLDGNSNLKFFSTAFTGNKGRGAAVFFTGGNQDFLNCTFASNESYGTSSAIYGEHNTNVNIRNSIIWGNYPSSSIYLQNNTPAVSYTVWDGLPAALQGNENSNKDPVFIAPFVLNLPGPSSTPSTAGNFRIQLTGSAFNTGNNVWLPTGDTLLHYDLGRQKRIMACIADRGAYEFNIAPDENGVLYVDSSAAGSGDGSSWTNAMWNLADALEVIKCRPEPKIREIRVAQGTYRPKYIQGVNQSADPRNKSLFVSDSIRIYAGYPSGGGGDTIARNRELYPVVLDGRIGVDTYAYHVMILSGKDILLDGFTVINGKAVGQGSIQSQGTIYQNQGGGINVASGTDAIINNCIFDRDTAIEQGGAIYFDGGSNARAMLYNCHFTRNHATEGGAVFMKDQKVPSAFTNCSFRGNKATANGAGLRLESSSPRIVNCLFSGNTTGTRGAAVYCGGTSNPLMLNSTFAGNYSGPVSSAVIDAELNNSNQTEYSYPRLGNCIIWGNLPANTPNGIVTPHATIHNSIVQGGFSANGSTGIAVNDPQFVAAVPATATPAATGNYQLQPASIHAVDKGSNAIYLSADTQGYRALSLDLELHNRVTGCSIDLGAYEFTPANALPPMAADAGGVLYVDSSVALSGTGNSWQTAIKDLAEALRTATFDKRIKQVQVARGTYYPKYDSLSACSNDPGDQTFYLPKGLQLLGGYPTGGGIRQPTVNIVTLTGKWQTGTVSHQAYHVVTVKEDSTLTDGFVISGGDASGSSGEDNGGGMIVKARTGTVQSILFYNNKASYGGGLYVSRQYDSTGYPDINHCYFYADTSEFGGGGMRLDKGIASSCVLISNYSGNIGGAALVKNGKVSTSIFTGNTAEHGGGGVFIGGGGTDTGNVLISCLISGNKVASAGSGFGGGIMMLDTGFRIINSTIAGNYSHTGGGISGSSNPFINTIIWGNEGVSDPQVNGVAAQMFDHCIVQGGNGGNMLNADPGFYDPVPGSMAPTLLGNYHISSCSPASGSGIYLAAFENATDLDGMPRSNDSSVDRGAYQFTDINIRASGDGIVYVDSGKLTYGDGSSWDYASNSLADALAAALKDTTIVSVKVAQGTYYPQYSAGNGDCISGDVRDRTFTLPSGVAILGGYPTGGAEDSLRDPKRYRTTMSGNTGRKDIAGDNVYHVAIAAGPLTHTVLDGWTLSGGYANGTGTVVVHNKSIARNSGGAIVLAGSNDVQIRQCVLDSNYAQFQGGGILSSDSNNAVISNCIISNNRSAAYGGGSACVSYAAPEYSNVLFIDNKANIGGGMGNYAHAQPVINNSTFYRNISLAWGAAMDNEGTTAVTVRNSIFSNNPDGAGIAGGITNPGGIQYSLVQLPSGVLAGTGNINADPVFTDTTDLKGQDGLWATADDGLLPGKCSPAINAGANGALAAADTMDITSGIRIRQNIVDMGAYEGMGFVLDTVAGHTTATDALCGAEWKQFYRNPEVLVLSINTTYAGTDTFHVSGSLNPLYGSNSIAALGQPFGLSDTLYPMNRSWSVTTNAVPSGPVGLRFYFNDQDSADIAGSQPFGSLQSLAVYKVAGTDPYNPSSSGFRKYTYAGIADTAHFTLGFYQGLRYAEFQVNEFSSGTMALLPAMPLPVYLSEFRLLTDDCNVTLYWTLDGVFNLQETEVQYSSDAVTFEPAGKVAVNGTGQYRYTVVQQNETGYYRLKFTDNDGRYEFSPVLPARTRCAAGDSWTIAPNPLADGCMLQLNLNTADIAGASVVVKTISGQTIKTIDWPVQKGRQERFLPFDGLAQGIYTIFLLDHKGRQIGIPVKAVKK